MRRARRADKGQAEIVAALRKAGCSVEVLSDVGRGVPDLLVGRNGVNTLIEVKEPGEQLTPLQHVWHDRWRGVIEVVETEEEALRVVGAL